jgi:hypothetical protein
MFGLDVKNLIGEELYYIDKVTHSKKFDGRSLGVCIGQQVNPVNGANTVWFENPFLGFRWQYVRDVKEDINLK